VGSARAIRARAVPGGRACRGNQRGGGRGRGDDRGHAGRGRGGYQGTLTGGGPGAALFGRPDFLVRADLLPAPDGEPRPGGIHYEVVDAKLARSAKARAVLQETEPRWMHLALGDGEFASFKVSEFAAYERQTRRLLEGTIGEEPAAEVYPEPVEHCAICRWRDMCRERRRLDDDLARGRLVTCPVSEAALSYSYRSGGFVPVSIRDHLTEAQQAMFDKTCAGISRCLRSIDRLSGAGNDRGGPGRAAVAAR
jgi:hypothetical protein